MFFDTVSSINSDGKSEMEEKECATLTVQALRTSEASPWLDMIDNETTSHTIFRNTILLYRLDIVVTSYKYATNTAIHPAAKKERGLSGGKGRATGVRWR